MNLNTLYVLSRSPNQSNADCVTCASDGVSHEQVDGGRHEDHRIGWNDSGLVHFLTFFVTTTDAEG